MASLKEQVLTMEQMAHLKKLGVDTSNASVVLIYKDDNGNEVEWDEVIEAEGGNFFCKDDTFDEEYDLSENILDAETGYYDHSFREDCGVFTVDDVLKMLPKEFQHEGKTFEISMNYSPDDGFEIGYAATDLSLYFDSFVDGILLQAAYDTLCWLAENKLL